MVHCVSSSEPDSGDAQLTSDEWRGNAQPISNPGSVKEAPLNQTINGQQGQQQPQATPVQQQQQQQPGQPQTQTKPTYVESSTVSSGIQVGNLVEQAAAGGTLGLTLTDTQQHQFHHELADTTHLENTHEPMDTTTTTITTITSSPNHSIHSDTIVIAEHISEELTSGDDYLINKDLVRELQSEQQLQITTESSYHINHEQHEPMLVDNTSDDNCVSNIYQPEQESQQQAAAAALIQQETQKFYSVGIAPNVYPHLYNFTAEQGEQQQQQQLAVVNYQTSEKLQIQQQAFFNPYVYNEGGLTNYVEGAVELEEESADSSDEDDEEL